MSDGNGNGNNAQDKTFTQDQVNSIVEERLARQKKQYADYEDLKAKAQKYDDQQQAAKTESEKLTDLQKANQALIDRLDNMEKKSALDNVKAKISEKTGVPVSLLTGKDEEECQSQADSIVKFASGKKYPGIKEETHGKRKSRTSSHGETTDDDYRAFAAQIFGKSKE